MTADHWPADSASAIAHRLCGAWSLVEWRSVAGDAEPRFPFGQDALGSLHYVGDSAIGGIMMAQLAMRDRPPLSIAVSAAQRCADKCAAFDSYVAYGGLWRVDGTRVIHQVTSSLFANWIGTELVRTIRFIDEQLVLATVPEASNRAVHQLTWRRALR